MNATNFILNYSYYLLRPVIPRSVQISVRRQMVLWKRRSSSHIWPIDPNAVNVPEGWNGWPGQKRFALVLTHDVDTAVGQEKCRKLAELEMKAGFCSSFNFVPKRYTNSSDLHDQLTRSGFEVAVHGLYHDGRLFLSRKIFEGRAKQINYFLKKWGAVGFNSPSMHHNLNWIHALDIEYDQSTFDTDPFEPQPEGIGSIFPLWIRHDTAQTGYVEMPYTLPQDHTLFIVMKEKDTRIWKQKLEWIAQKGGMVLLNTHPDYMDFDDMIGGREDYPARLYAGFLEYIQSEYEGQYWHVLPREMARFWRKTMVPSRTQDR